jgi:hypothetical protein
MAIVYNLNRDAEGSFTNFTLNTGVLDQQSTPYKGRQQGGYSHKTGDIVVKLMPLFKNNAFYMLAQKDARHICSLKPFGFVFHAVRDLYPVDH